MFGGLGGMNPKKMQAIMKQMGMSQEEIDAVRVIIEKNDGSKLVIEPASVQKITMQGQETFQIAGEVREEGAESFSQDIETIMEKTSASKEDAIKALEETGDLAEAIMKLGK